MYIALILLMILTAFIWFIEHCVEQQRMYEFCREHRKGTCKDILIDKKCNRCPYLNKGE